MMAMPATSQGDTSRDDASRDGANRDGANRDGANRDRGFGLYVHWPFCRAKCPYCDFNSHVAAEVDHARFAAAFQREMAHMAAHYGTGQPLSSLFFGGGTPSLMPPELVAGIIRTADDLFGLAPDIEITAEANPTSAEANMFAGFAAAGVNRLSLGVQSLRDDGLVFLGREHSAGEAVDALRQAERHFRRLSIDLIYARKDQTMRSWTDEIHQALDLGITHMSVYQLTIEPGTVFFTRARRGEVLTMDDDHAADLFETTERIMEEAGLPAYEISNHARPGEECRHNLTYWRAGEWIGVGPGAHGRLDRDGGRRGLATRRSPASWLEQVETSGHGIETISEEDAGDAVAEALMMGLRLSEGVNLAALSHRFGDLGGHIDMAARDQLIASDLLVAEAGSLRVTRQGRLVLNRILTELLVTNAQGEAG